ncbi:MAG: hypothetical protein U5K30_17850 [Acidimicrobiales bacterium]|nr:hypothetical protein [Acidimicrobiales bacterium]
MLTVAVMLLGACGSSSSEGTDASSATTGAGSSTEPSGTAGDALDISGVDSFAISQSPTSYRLSVRQVGGDPDQVAELWGSDISNPSGVEVGNDRLVLAGDLCLMRDCERQGLQVALIDFGSGALSVESLGAFDPNGYVEAVHAVGDEVIVVANENGTTSIVAFDTATGDQRVFDWRPEPYDAEAIRGLAAEASDEVIDSPRTTYCAAAETLWAVSSPGLGISDRPMSMSAVSIDLASGRATERGELPGGDVRNYPDVECTPTDATLTGPGVNDVSFSID